MAKKKISALITGYDGFVGPHLAGHLLSEGRRVSGTIISGGRPNPLHKGRLEKSVALFPIDLRNYENVRDLVKEAQPDEIYHLAGISHVPTSWKNPVLTYAANVMGSVHLFEALREWGRKVRTLVVTSAEIYGSLKPAELPAVETLPLHPGNPYAASKAALDLIAFQWGRYPGMHIVRARPFSHTGPGQTPGFVCPSFARQVAEIALGAPPVIKVGNLSARRDFTDVRDVVRAYRMLVEKGRHDEAYNICSGRTRSIKSILQTLKSFSPMKIEVVTDPEKLRPTDISETRGSFAKLRRDTGWKPQIPFSRTLRDLYEYWMAELR